MKSENSYHPKNKPKRGEHIPSKDHTGADTNAENSNTDNADDETETKSTPDRSDRFDKPSMEIDSDIPGKDSDKLKK